MTTAVSALTINQLGQPPFDALKALKAALDIDLDALNLLLGVGVRARGVVTANVASLSAFTVAGNDDITYVEGDVVLLAKQTTAAQCGPYVVGAVAGGAAPLTRPAWWAAAAAIPQGIVIEVGSEGTLYGGTSWKAMCAAGCVVDTDDPLFYPKSMKGIVTLVAGVKALGSTQGFWLYSTTKSVLNFDYDTPDTITASTGGLKAATADKTAGKVGTAAATIKAIALDGTTDTDNVSTVQWCVTNW